MLFLENSGNNLKFDNKLTKWNKETKKCYKRKKKKKLNKNTKKKLNDLSFVNN